MKVQPSFNLLIVTLIFLGFAACKDNTEEKAPKPKKVEPVLDLNDLKEAGHLRALIDNSSTSYFVYKGAPMGFEYELLSRFAKEVDLELEVIPISNMDVVIDSLQALQGDIIAANLTVTRERAEQLAFTEPLIYSHQVLVQRADDDLVRTPSEMIGKEVYLRKNSSFYNRIQNLSEEVGGPIHIKEVSGNTSVEELIKQVSNGGIDYTVADQHVAKINRAFYRNLYIKTPVSLEQQIAWAVRKTSPDLLNAINQWLEKFKKTVDFRVIYLKYYGNTSLYRSRVKSKLYTAKSGQISQYDEMIKAESEQAGWDWRLVSSLVYQESQFDHHAESWAGAYGLMQLMPETAQAYGVDSSSGPRENLKAGLKYLKWLEEEFKEKVADSTERRKFVLAAYNVGLGHVYDAIRLATKHELNPELWEENVATMLKNKSKPKYYQDPVAYYGYCRGSEPFAYVNQIMKRYDHYKNMTDSLGS
ncbi:MAG: transporter substrate-binding domain-containing protein [Vicingaceae bacterium]